MSLAGTLIGRNAPTSGGVAVSIYQLIRDRVVATPDSVALAASGRGDLTFSALEQQIRQVADDVTRSGVGRGDRVAIVLTNGPEMATAFLGTAMSATAAPLNPQFTAAEFEFYLTDLDARAVIVEAGGMSPVRAVAQSRGLPLLEIVPRRDLAAGRFEFRTQGSANLKPRSPAEGEVVALILHTSGTTSRPKIIPLSHANLCASARNIGETLRLSPSDRCLNVMPLFHIHGLIAGLLAPLAAGGSVVCTPGFSSTQFFRWLEEFQPTWYTAVPAMHQEVLVQAEHNQAVIETHRLRFIRSSSAALAPQVTSDLERVFATPVVEAYGMTEAAHQIAANPLPPVGWRKVGSVGLPAGPEVTILDEAGQTLPQGETGEIAIRGANVSLLGRPGAGGRSADDWFRTGDLGRFDADGYLFISGRIKEIINRGGEKFSPCEIDEVLLGHPGVAQAVACAVPDPRLGEDVVAVVVRRPGSTVPERELREFASTRLSPFKVPRRMIFVEQIPKGSTGKIQRIGLAARLGIEASGPARTAPSANFVAPKTPNELIVAQIFRDALKLEQVGATDNFFELGGDSLASVGVIVQLEEQLAIKLDEREMAFGTVQQVAAACDRAASAVRSPAKYHGDSSREPNNLLALKRRVRRDTRRALVSVTRPVARWLPIDRYPGWFGKLHEFKVPNNVAARVWQGPGGGSNSRVVLQLLESVSKVEGDVAECGVWKGATLIPVGLFLKQRHVDKAVLGFDTFEGLGDIVDVDINMGGQPEQRKQASGFSDTSYARLLEKVHQYGLEPSVKLVKGYFQDTFPAHSERRFSFVHLDCVLYESYKQCLEFFYPRMSKQGIILLDEYRDPPWPGCTKAVDDFVAGIPEIIEEIRSDNQIKFFIRKL